MSEEEKVALTGQHLLLALYSEIFENIEGAVRDDENPHFKSKFTTLPTVIVAIKKHVLAAGCSYLQRSVVNEKGPQLDTILIHKESGASMEIGSMMFPAMKQDPASWAAASTYLRRYALVMAFNLPFYDDDVAMAMANNETNPHPLLVILEEAAKQGVEELKAKYRELNKSENEDFLSVWKANEQRLKANALRVENE